MKKRALSIVLAGVAAVLTAGIGFGSGGSAEQGEKLFNDPGLGGSANETSCASCHPGGKGLEQAGGKENLPQMINTCIERPLKGQALGEDSIEMESLVLYIKSFK